MDLWIVATVSALLLTTCESVETSNNPNMTHHTVTTPNPPSTSCTCPQTAPTSKPSGPAPALSVLTIHWKPKCIGDVSIFMNSDVPVCYSSLTKVQSLLTDVCKNKKGCKGVPTHLEGSDLSKGYNISEKGADNTTCKTLSVQCTEEHVPDLRAELQGYKVVTALFSCALVVLLLICFTRPTVKALQKRLSGRRQNRWIGPTQSHSVSYHRGQTAVHKNNDGEKRLSYPALERLAVSNSREPSSNRSSYNF